MDDSTRRKEFERLLEELDRRDLLNALPILRDRQKIVHALYVTGRNIAGAAQLRDRKVKYPRPYRPVLIPENELPEDEYVIAPAINAKASEVSEIFRD